MSDAGTPEGWRGILAKGERILWQGTASARIRLLDIVSFETVFGLFFAGFAVFWVTMASGMTGGRHGPPSFPFSLFPLFGIPFILIGLHMIVGRIFYDAYKRRGTHYTLTNRAAYTATSAFGRRKLDRVPFDEMTELTLEDGNPGAVWFGERIVETSYRRKGRNRRRTTRTPLGFREIDDPRKVFGLLRDARDDTEAR